MKIIQFFNKRISRTVAIAIIAVFVLLAFGGVLGCRYLYQLKENLYNPTYDTKINKPVVNQVQQNQDEIAGWKTYESTKYGFEIQYPKEWTFAEYPGINGVGFGNPPTPEGTKGGSPIVIHKATSIITGYIDESPERIEGKYEGLIGGPGEAYEGLRYIKVRFRKGFTIYDVRFNEVPYITAEQNRENEDIFEKMIATFRVID